MKDKRNDILARDLLGYSVALQPGEKIMLEIRGQGTLELAKEIIRQATELGAVPFWYYNDLSLLRSWIKDATAAQFEGFGKLHLKVMKEIDAWLGLYGEDNPFDLNDIDAQQLKNYQNLES